MNTTSTKSLVISSRISISDLATILNYHISTGVQTTQPGKSSTISQALSIYATIIREQHPNLSHDISTGLEYLRINNIYIDNNIKKTNKQNEAAKLMLKQSKPTKLVNPPPPTDQSSQDLLDPQQQQELAKITFNKEPSLIEQTKHLKTSEPSEPATQEQIEEMIAKAKQLTSQQN